MKVERVWDGGLYDNREVIEKIETGLRSLSEIREAAVIIKKQAERVFPIHLSDLFGDIGEIDAPPANASDVAVKESSTGDGEVHDNVEKPLAISYGGDMEIKPDDPRTLQDILKNASVSSKDKGITFIYPDGKESFLAYPALLDKAQRVLAGLRKMGMNPGEHVVFQCNDNQNFIIAFWACILGGFLPAPIAVAPIYTEMNAIVNKLFNVWKLLDKPLILTDDALKQSIEGVGSLWGDDKLRVESVDFLVANQPDEDWYQCTPDSLVLNLLTSGSTGVPKCVQHPHRTILWRCKANSIYNHFTSEDVSLNWMPLDHVGGIVMFHVLDVFLGCSQHIAKIESYISNPLNWLNWVHKYRATISWAPNFAFAMMNDYEEKIKAGKWDLSSLRHILNGGEAVVAKVAHRFLEILEQHGLSHTAMFPAYGMSETSSGVVQSKNFTRNDLTSGVKILDKTSLTGVLRETTPEDPNGTVFTQVGHPIPGVCVRIVDENDEVLTESKIGRLQIKSPTLMNGYYKNPEANSEVFQKDGWFNTGDLGFLNNGSLTITGREKDIIILNGANYYNYEIESVVEEIPGVEVTFSAACAIPDKDGADMLAVFFVSTNPDFDFKVKLIQQVRQRIIRKIGINMGIIIPIEKEIFPKTNSGKIQRAELRKAYQTGNFNDIIKRIDIYTANDRTMPDWIYRDTWRERPGAGTVEFRDGIKLVFADSSDAPAWGEAVMVVRGSAFKKTNPYSYVIDIHAFEDYTRLIGAVIKDFGQIDYIIHMWNLNSRKEPIASVGELRESQYLSSFSLSFLVRALYGKTTASLKWIVATSNAYHASGHDRPDYEKSTVTGIIKTIPHENPKIKCKHIDFETGTNQVVLQHIGYEAANDEEDIVVAYRHGKRLVPGIERVDIKACVQNDLSFKKNALYLVTGGLGGIGKILCKFLLKKYGAKVLIVGRNELPLHDSIDEKSAAFHELKEYEKYGGSVSYRAVDICSLEDVKAAVKEAEDAEKTSLAGVIHLAGIIQEYRLDEQTVELLEEMYRAKVYGLWVLHKLVEDSEDAVFISTSSARTLTAGMTVGSYCSASGFAEVFSYYQRACSKVKSFCLSWSLWDEVGMGKGLIIRNLLEKRGYSLINERTGLLSFIAGLRCDQPLLYVGLNGEKEEIQRMERNNLDERFVMHVYYSPAEEETAIEDVRRAVEKVTAEISDLAGLAVLLERLENIPQTPSGEIDRAYLKTLGETEDGSAENTQPVTPTERKLAELWKRILNVKNVGVLDNFFELGGHSLKATQMLSGIKESFNIEFPLQELFLKPCVQGLAVFIDEKLADSGQKEIETIDCSTYGNIVPMSSAQKRQWVLYQIEPENPFYNNTVIIKLQGKIDLQSVKKSLQFIVDRHETLRTTFDVIDGELCQIIHQEHVLEPEVIELVELEEEEAGTKVVEIIKEESMRPFNLVTGPVIRYISINISSRECVLVVSIHHIVSDGWSVGVLAKEFAKVYQSLSKGEAARLEDLKIQYADFSIWQNEWIKKEEHQKQLAYWKEKLSGTLPSLDILTDLPRPPVQTYRGKTQVMQMDKGLTETLKELGRTEGSTLFMVLLSGFVALLHNYTGQDDIIVGSLIANRNRTELEPLIGFFVNTLALRIDASGDPSFNQILERVRPVTLEAYENQDLQFDMLVDELGIERDSSRHPVFQILFILQNAPMEAVHMGDVNMHLDIFFNDTSKFDMSMQIFENDQGLKVILEYNTDLFFDSTMERLMEHFKTLMESAAVNFSKKLSELSMLSTEELCRIKDEWNDTDATYPSDVCLHQLLESCVEKTPDACAFVFKGQRMTYREVNEKANKLARLLREKGTGPDRIVGIMTERSFEMVIGILAILKAGGAYMPIDPDYPGDRVSFMLEDSHTAIVLSNSRFRGNINFEGEIIDLDDPSAYTSHGANLTNINSPGDLAYLIYTSGSTGKPKGVMIEHTSVVNIITDLQEKYPLLEKDAYLLKTTYTFDVSVAELFGWFHAGGKLVILDKGAEKDPGAILRAMDEEGVTHVNFVPSMLNAFLDTLTEREIKIINKLKYVLVAGEAIHGELIRKFQGMAKDVVFENIYGPTESTIYGTYYPLSKYRGGKNVPIGRSMKNMKAYIVDKYNRLLPAGIPGELCLAGTGLARGYFNNEELTAQKFVPNPFLQGQRMYKTGDLAKWMPDGNIEFLGRLDHQVKIRGFRIELGEIEMAIKSHEGVKECVVVAVNAPNSIKRLVAYIVMEQQRDVNWRAYLTKLLPEYMVPGYFIPMDKFPLNRNGKIDRKALPAPTLEHLHINDGYEAPRSEKEKLLVEIWESMLGVDRVGINDDFFKLGGDSISVIQMISRLRKEGYNVEPRMLFMHKTIGQLAPVLQKLSEEYEASDEAVTGEVILTPIQHWFFEQEFENSHYWNLPVLVTFKKCYSPEHIKRAITLVVNHHDALKMNYCKEAEGWKQVSGELVESVALEVFDFTALLAEEQAKRLLEVSKKIQDSLSFEKDLLLHSALFTYGQGEQKLLMAAHHLVVDAVSWRIIVEDLITALHKLEIGEEVQFLRKTASYQRWAEALARYAQSEEAKKETSYWKQVLERVTPIPLKKPGTGNTEGDCDTLCIKLGKEYTQSLVTSAGWAYNTEINDLMLTSLLRAWQCCTGSSNMGVVLEGHGREDIIRGVDISRTTGWFTTAFPVCLEAPVDATIGEQIKQVKETLRGIPNKGIGFGILKYLCEDEEIKGIFSRNGSQVCFNYIGQMSQKDAEASVLLSDSSTGPFHSPTATRPYLIEVNIIQSEGEMVIYLTHNREASHKEFAEKFGALYKAQLEEMVEYCLKPENKGFTPSDFPLARLAQAQVDSLPEGLEDVYMLSPMQQGMLFHALMGENSSSYCGYVKLTLRGRMNEDIFEHTWNVLIKRHPILRSIYRWHGVEQPVQIVLASLLVRVERCSVEGMSPVEQETEVNRLVSEAAGNVFDLSKESPVKLHLIRVSEEVCHFVWVFHHIAVDGWSVSILINEMLEIYQQLYNGKVCSISQPRPYREYIRWLAVQDKNKAREFWKRYLDGFRTPTPLMGSAGRNEAVSERRMVKETFYLAKELKSRLEELARNRRVTFNTLLQAAWGILLGYYGNTSDIMFGITVSGRPTELEDVEKMVGVFINSLPFRVILNGEEPLETFLEGLQMNTVEIKEYEYTLLSEIREVSDIPAGEEMFNTLLIYQNFRDESGFKSHGRVLNVDNLHGAVDINYDLVLEFTPGESILFEVYYNRNRWSRGFIEQMVNHFTAILENMAQNPEACIKDIEVMTSAEAERILKDWALSAKVETLYEDQEEVYRGVNDASRKTEIYILGSSLNPLPMGIPGEIYVASEDLAEDCGSWSDWMKENAIPHLFDQEGARKLYKTGDIGMWKEDGSIVILDMV